MAPKPKAPTITSEGHRQLFVLRHATHAEIARAAKVTAAAVTKWGMGGLPSDPQRESLRRAYGIEPADWDRLPFRDEPKTTTLQPSPAAPSLPPGVPHTEAEASGLEPVTRRQLAAEIRKALPELKPKERMQAIKDLSLMIAADERAEREREQTVRTLLKSDEWRRVCQCYAKHLSPVAGALEALESAHAEVASW